MFFRVWFPFVSFRFGCLLPCVFVFDSVSFFVTLHGPVVMFGSSTCVWVKLTRDRETHVAKTRSDIQRHLFFSLTWEAMPKFCVGVSEDEPCCFSRTGGKCFVKNRDRCVWCDLDDLRAVTASNTFNNLLVSYRLFSPDVKEKALTRLEEADTDQCCPVFPYFVSFRFLLSVEFWVLVALCFSVWFRFVFAFRSVSRSKGFTPSWLREILFRGDRDSFNIAPIGEFCKKNL